MALEASPGALQLSVVVPTYNEAANIAGLLDRLSGVLGGILYEIVVVDDDSPDRTWRVAETHAAGDPRVRVMRRRGPRGLAASVLDAMAAASGDAVAVIDGDGQHDESALPEMAAAVLSGSVQLCVCCRPGPQGSPLRCAVTATGTAAARLLVPALRSLPDPLSGFFVVSRELYCACVPAPAPGRAFKVLWLFAAAGPRTAVVTRVLRGRDAGASKLSLRVLAADLMFAWALRRGRPAMPSQQGPAG